MEANSYQVVKLIKDVLGSLFVILILSGCSRFESGGQNTVSSYSTDDACNLQNSKAFDFPVSKLASLSDGDLDLQLMYLDICKQNGDDRNTYSNKEAYALQVLSNRGRDDATIRLTELLYFGKNTDQLGNLMFCRPANGSTFVMNKNLSESKVAGLAEKGNLTASRLLAKIRKSD